VEALDELHTSKSYETLYEHLAARDDAAELHLAWRFARAHHDLADSLPEADKGRKEALLRAGLAVAEAALARAEEGDAESALCHKWVGILLGALGTYLPTKEKVANSFRIRDALQTAAEMRPADGSVQLALGEWCFKVAGIGWVEANAAKLLFGQAPESTYAEALDYYERAWERKPSKKAAYKASLACDKLSRGADSAAWRTRALELPGAGAADAEIDRLAAAAR